MWLVVTLLDSTEKLAPLRKCLKNYLPEGVVWVRGAEVMIAHRCPLLKDSLEQIKKLKKGEGSHVDIEIQETLL